MEAKNTLCFEFNHHATVLSLFHLQTVIISQQSTWPSARQRLRVLLSIITTANRAVDGKYDTSMSEHFLHPRNCRIECMVVDSSSVSVCYLMHSRIKIAVSVLVACTCVGTFAYFVRACARASCAHMCARVCGACARAYVSRMCVCGIRNKRW